MTATLTAPTVESYWRMAWGWWREEVAPHGETCPDLACADVRAFMGLPPVKTELQLLGERDRRGSSQ